MVWQGERPRAEKVVANSSNSKHNTYMEVILCLEAMEPALLEWDL
jgi:hypothetical protein